MYLMCRGCKILKRGDNQRKKKLIQDEAIKVGLQPLTLQLSET